MHQIGEYLAQAFSITEAETATLHGEKKRCVLVTGPVGIGKTTRLGELADILARNCAGVGYLPQTGCLMRSVSIGRSLWWHKQPQGIETFYDSIKGHLPPDFLPDLFLARLKLSPKTLSGGEHRLMSLAIVLAKAEGVALLDEPTASLSAPARLWVQHMLARWLLHDDRRVVVVVSHEIDLEAFANTVLDYNASADRPVLRNGAGNWRNLFEAPPLPASLRCPFNNTQQAGHRRYWRWFTESLIVSLLITLVVTVIAPIAASEARGAHSFKRGYSLDNFRNMEVDALSNPALQTMVHFGLILLGVALLAACLAKMSGLRGIKARLAVWLVGIQCIPVVVFINAWSNTFAGGPVSAVVVIGTFITVTTTVPLLIRTLQSVDEDVRRAFESNREKPSILLSIDSARVEVCKQAVSIVILAFVGAIVGEYLAPNAGGLGASIGGGIGEAQRIALIIVTVVIINIVHAVAHIMAEAFVPFDLRGQFDD